MVSRPRNSIDEPRPEGVRPEQVYEVLTDGEKFAAATGQPARISDREGDEFTLFGGRVAGRQTELVRDERVVQAWRFGDDHPHPWDAGVYSVVRFTLEAEGKATKLTIDHDAIPTECQDHIASGYQPSTTTQSRRTSPVRRCSSEG